jgi:tetratricopeptide (TPR) repeat protein
MQNPDPEDLSRLLTLLDARQYQATENLARETTMRFPLHATGWKVLAAVLRQTGRHVDALAPMQQVAALSPADAHAHFNLGNTLRSLGKLDAAIAAYRLALDLRPDYAKAYYGLGNTLNDLGRQEDAVRLYQRALEINPEYAQANLNMANALQELGQADGAGQNYRRAIDLRPNWDAAYFNLHALLLSAGELTGAIQCMQTAVELAPANISHHFFLGLLLDYSGNPERAQAHFECVAKSIGLHLARLDAWQYLKSKAHNATLPPLIGGGPHAFQIGIAAANKDGLVLEFGVRYGKSIRQIAALVDQRVHGFDSFEGLPESWHHEPKGSYSTYGQLPAVPNHVTLHPGWFEDTLPKFLQVHGGNVRFLNIDCDIYSSTKTVLDLLAHRIVAGSVIVFDEYIGNTFWRQDEFKAFQEAVTRHGWTYEYLCFSFATKQVVTRILSVRPT